MLYCIEGAGGLSYSTAVRGRKREPPVLAGLRGAEPRPGHPKKHAWPGGGPRGQPHTDQGPAASDDQVK